MSDDASSMMAHVILPSAIFDMEYGCEFEELGPVLKQQALLARAFMVCMGQADEPTTSIDAIRESMHALHDVILEDFPG